MACRAKGVGFDSSHLIPFEVKIVLRVLIQYFFIISSRNADDFDSMDRFAPTWGSNLIGIKPAGKICNSFILKGIEIKCLFD